MQIITWIRKLYYIQILPLSFKRRIILGLNKFNGIDICIGLYCGIILNHGHSFSSPQVKSFLVANRHVYIILLNMFKRITFLFPNG